MNLRSGSDIADLSFHQDGGIDGLESLDRLFRLSYILFERMSGCVEDDGIEPRPGCFDGLCEGVRVIRV